MKLAAIDIGTNSCRLLIVEADSEKITAVHRELDTTRIGEGVAETAFLNQEAMERTLCCLDNFLVRMNDFGVSAYRTIATSAVRESRNRESFVEMVQSKLGMKIEVLSGEQEAWLSYQGVCSGLNIPGDPLVVDLGGGSTEFVWQGKTNNLLSLPVGAVRATEQSMESDQIRSILQPLVDKRHEFINKMLVFVGGTATSAVAIKLGLRQYKSELVHGQKLTLDEIESIYLRLRDMTPQERLIMPGLQQKRADIIVKGMLVMVEIVRAINHSLLMVSESDLLDAIVNQIYAERYSKQNK